MVANVFFDAYLTGPGKYLLGTMLGDDEMVATAVPNDPKGQAKFVGEMVDFMTGKLDIVRDPEEAKRVFAVLNTEDEEDDRTTTTSKKKRKAVPTNAILVY